MIGKIFSFLSVISIPTAIVTGNVEKLSQAVITGAEKGVNICFSIMGMMILWNGILNVFKKVGLIKGMSRLLKPLLKIIFPDAFKQNIATDEITACISANLLGISNSATPLGIKAIEQLSKASCGNKASPDMITLSIIGCSCFNLVPTTLLAIRGSAGGQINTEIIVPIWICSGTCMILGILLSKTLGKILG